jgi:hypothetical protein
MRIVTCSTFSGRQRHIRERSERALVSFALSNPGVGHYRLGNLIAYAHHGIQSSHGFLEDHRNP